MNITFVVFSNANFSMVQYNVLVVDASSSMLWLVSGGICAAL